MKNWRQRKSVKEVIEVEILICNTKLNAANAAMSAYAEMCKIPVVGPALGTAAAFACLAHGAYLQEYIEKHGELPPYDKKEDGK